MTGKVFRSVFFACVITLFLTLLLIIAVSRGYLADMLEEEIRNEAVYAAHGIELLGEDYFDELTSERRVTWIAPDGTVIADSDYPAGQMENHGDREEFIEALQNGSGSSVRYSDTQHSSLFLYAVRMRDGSVVRVSGPNASLWSLLSSMITPSFLIIIIVLALSFALALRMSRNVLKPVNDIDLTSTDTAKGYPELKPFIEKINRQNTFINSRMSELRRKQEEFGVITENMTEGFIVVNRRMDILSYNTSALRILGSGLSDMRPTVDSLRHRDVLLSVVETALGGRHNEQGLETDGSVYRIIANPVSDDGEISGAVVIILDVTEKENREKMRREFSSNVTHELKTPLTSIRGASELMLGGLVRQEDMKKFAQTIYDESCRLMALIDDILRLSQMDESGMVQEKVSIDLNDTARAVVERMKPTAAKRGITLTFEGENAVVSGVPTIIDEMIFNLVDNAIKYNTAAGSVRVRVHTVDERPTVTVSDTGIGIPQEHIGRIFERFYRVDKSRSRAIGGTGLGLSIVKHAAVSHNADISVNSRDGEGTTVTVQF